MPAWGGAGWRMTQKKKWCLHIFNLLPNCCYPRLFIILSQNNHNKSKAITSSNRICRSIEIPRSRVSYEIYFIILFVISIFSFLPSPHLFPCWTYKQNVLFSPKTRRVTSFIHLFIYILCILFASHLVSPLLHMSLFNPFRLVTIPDLGSKINMSK